MFRKKMPEALWQSIETGGTGLGIPDSWYCFPRGITGWVEFKTTTGWAVTVRPEQIGWALSCARKGGRVFCFVRRKSSAGARRCKADELWAVLPAGLALLSEAGLKALPATLIGGQWAGGPAAWDWEGVRRLLTR